MLGLDTNEDLKNEFERSNIVFVAEDMGKVIGYIVADTNIDQKFINDEYKTWFDDDLKSIYYNNPQVITLASIAVDPEYSSKGVTKLMYSKLSEWLLENNFEYLFSIVTVAPLTNFPTILWHTKMGFKRLAMGRPRELFGLKNYVVFYCIKGYE